MADEVSTNPPDGAGPAPVSPVTPSSPPTGTGTGRATARLAAIARGVALFFGLSMAANGMGELRRHGFGIATWPVDLRWLPHWLAVTLLTTATLLLLMYVRRPQAGSGRRWATVSLTAFLTATAIIDSLRFWQLLASGSIHSRTGVPFSMLIAIALGFVTLVAMIRKPGPLRIGWLAVTLVLLVIATPLALGSTFGRTDYRRPADVIVVLGCLVHDDGRPSDALSDRVLKAVELYKQGLAPQIIFSGGPGTGTISEPEAMRDLAISRGVPRSAIELDVMGVNTKATVANTAKIFRRAHYKRVLVVSHYYHLPRIKLAYERFGVTVYTVPAQTNYPMDQLIFHTSRDAVALWWYFFTGNHYK